MHFEKSDKMRCQLWCWSSLALMLLAIGINRIEGAEVKEKSQEVSGSAKDIAAIGSNESSRKDYLDGYEKFDPFQGQQFGVGATRSKRLANHNHNEHNHHQDDDHHHLDEPHHYQSASQHSGSHGSDSPTRPSQFDEKLDSARQLVQKIRERCLSGLEQQQHHHNSREPSRLRRQSQERSSSGDTLGKLGELGDKVRNKTTDARQLIANIRTKCAEILGSNHRDNYDHDHGHGHDHSNYNNQNHRDHFNTDHRDHSNTNHRERVPQRLRRQVLAAPSPSPPPSGFLAGQSAADMLTNFGTQVRDQTSAVAAAAAQQFETLRSQLAASVEKQLPKRTRRQVQYPQEQQPAAAGGIMKYISDLGQQAQQAQAITQFLQAAGASGSQGPAASAQASGGAQVAQVLTQLTDLIKSTQNRNARLVESSQRSLEATGQQATEVAKSAQGGLQAAISEMTQGLQRLAANNPNLVPDIKSLYQSVSSKLSSSSATGSPQTAVVPSQVAPPA